LGDNPICSENKKRWRLKNLLHEGQQLGLI